MILKRDDELNTLQTLFLEQTSSFVFLFGRKQIGKTTLLKEYIKDKDYLYFSCFEVLPHILFQSFLNQIKNYQEIKEQNVKSFEDILSLLLTLEFSKKMIFIFDDIQALHKIQKDMLTSFLNYWENFLKYKNIQIIFASSVNFSAKNNKEIISKANKIIYLKEFDYEIIKQLHPNIKKQEQLKLFALFGTNLNYLKKYDTNYSFEENLKNIIYLSALNIQKDGLNCFKDELSEISTYNAILYAISQGRTKIGEIANYLNVQSTYLTRYIQKLLDLMIIKRNIPLNEDTNSKFGRYEIEDNYMKFWYQVIFLDSDFININKIEKTVKEIEKKLQENLLQDAFKKYMSQFIQKNFQEFFKYEPVKILPWWNNKVYIDLVAYNSSEITFISLDYKASSHISKLYEELKSKANLFETSLDKNFALFSSNLG